MKKIIYASLFVFAFSVADGSAKLINMANSPLSGTSGGISSIIKEASDFTKNFELTVKDTSSAIGQLKQTAKNTKNQINEVRGKFTEKKTIPSNPVVSELETQVRKIEIQKQSTELQWDQKITDIKNRIAKLEAEKENKLESINKQIYNTTDPLKVKQLNLQLAQIDLQYDEQLAKWTAELNNAKLAKGSAMQNMDSQLMAIQEKIASTKEKAEIHERAEEIREQLKRELATKKIQQRARS